MKLSLVAAGIGLSSLRGPWSWSWFKVESWRARLRNDMGYQLLYRTSLAGTPGRAAAHHNHPGVR